MRIFRRVHAGVAILVLLLPMTSIAQSSRPGSNWRPLQAFENSLLFHPTPASKSWLQPPGQATVQDVWLEASDGNRIHAWWIPCPGATGAVLFCHGNAGNLSHRALPAFQLLEELKQSVLIFDYPGYGRSTGKPTEASCYAAGDAAYEWLTQEQGIPATEIVLFGKSLGGGIATDLAARRSHRALVLVKTFTSIPDMAKKSWLTASSASLVKNQFDNLAKIGRCPSPIFIAHGDRDRLIPIAQAQKLHEAAAAPKQLLVLKGSDHNDPLPGDLFYTLARFLAEHAPVTRRP